MKFKYTSTKKVTTLSQEQIDKIVQTIDSKFKIAQEDEEVNEEVEEDVNN